MALFPMAVGRESVLSVASHVALDASTCAQGMLTLMDPVDLCLFGGHSRWRHEADVPPMYTIDHPELIVTLGQDQGVPPGSLVRGRENGDR